MRKSRGMWNSFFASCLFVYLFICLFVVCANAENRSPPFNIGSYVLNTHESCKLCKCPALKLSIHTKCHKETVQTNRETNVFFLLLFFGIEKLIYICRSTHRFHSNCVVCCSLNVFVHWHRWNFPILCCEEFRE